MSGKRWFTRAWGPLESVPGAEYALTPLPSAPGCEPQAEFPSATPGVRIKSYEDLFAPMRWRKPWRVRCCGEGIPNETDPFTPHVSDHIRGAIFAVMALSLDQTFFIDTNRPSNAKRWLNKVLYDTYGDNPLWWQEENDIAYMLFTNYTPVWTRFGQGDGIEVGHFIDLYLKGKRREGWQRIRDYDDQPGWVEWHGSEEDYPLKWPLPNVWLGATLYQQKHAGRVLRYLLEARVAHRFVTVRPTWGPVDLTRVELFPGAFYNVLSGERVEYTPPSLEELLNLELAGEVPPPSVPAIEWVVASDVEDVEAPEWGKGPANPQDIERLRQQAEEAGVPFFFEGKDEQWGEVPDADH